eukprot:scaffold55573_cov55-Phaeocystis_antarctica.AAC.1
MRIPLEWQGAGWHLPCGLHDGAVPRARDEPATRLARPGLLLGGTAIMMRAPSHLVLTLTLT